MTRNIGELVQIKIVEEEKIVEVPKYVEKEVIVPRFVEKEYEIPVYKEVTYEKPTIVEKDLTVGLRALIKAEVEKGLAEVIQSLKISMEIPMSKIIQVRPGGRQEEINK